MQTRRIQNRTIMSGNTGSDKAAGFATKMTDSLLSMAKILLQSKRVSIIPEGNDNTSLIVMGNGPSLAETIREHGDLLKRHKTLAVNLAANSEEFYDLKPDYYVLADPLFFVDTDNPQMLRLRENLAQRVDWPMTLFIPARTRQFDFIKSNPNITVRRFNPVGVEGFDWLRHVAYSSGLGMPRPRNVLIPSIMIGLLMGYKTIWLVGADHSWTKTLEVNEDNEVISVQPHFYKENDEEVQTVVSRHKDIRLYQMMESLYVAFKAYFDILEFAQRRGATIYNSTPGSFIDAFERRDISQCK